MSLSDQIKHAWNAFRNKDLDLGYISSGGEISYDRRPESGTIRFRHDRSILTSIITQIAMDAASVDIRHARVDDNGRYLEEMDSGLNTCLTVEANIDQGGTHLRQNIFESLLNEGVIAIVPVDTTINPRLSGGYDIQTMRVGAILAWSPTKVNVRLWNDRVGRYEDIWVDKRFAAVVENPLYQVMNEPNSMLQRLNRKLQLLDAVDEASASNRLDIIIQLPYVIKSEARELQAEKRRKSIEMQLKSSNYGVAYTDGTERITQLNRPAENKLLKQIEYLTEMVHSQLGLTKSIFDGTADQATMLNYHNRTIRPLLTAVTEAMARTFLTKTARTQKQTVLYFRDPFRLVPMADIAEIADKFTRNEIMSTNEIRGVMGMKPSSDPKADELRNKNLPAPVEEPPPNEEPSPEPAERETDQNGT